MRRLTDFVLRHRVLVLAVWLLAMAAGIATAKTTTSRMTHTFTLPSSPSVHAAALIDRDYRVDGAQDPVVVVMTAPAGTRMDTAAARAGLAAVSGAVRATGDRVVDYPGTGDPAFLTKDRTTAYALVFVPPRGSDPAATAAGPLQSVARAAAPPGQRGHATGTAPLAPGTGSTKGHDVVV